jgi:HNH endonuclease
MADGFAQIFHNGLRADPTVVPGAERAPVRVIVPKAVLTDRIANGADASPTGSAILDETLTAISFPTLEEHLCEGGTINVTLDNNGQLIDVGREQRLFTKTQRTGFGVRDGGCRFPRCEKPPSWTEAHHISYWSKDNGPTDVANGILLCRYHHMLIHNTGWEIIRNTAQTGTRHHEDASGYWLKPPKERDPQQRLIEMPSKNPLITAMTHAAVS